MTRTVVTGPYSLGTGPWPWVVEVAAPGAGVDTRRFELRSQAQKYADSVRIQAAWDEL
jgi:hypothetical protein